MGRLSIALAGLALLGTGFAGACDGAITVTNCVAGANAGARNGISRITSVAPDWSRSTMSADAGISVPLVIQAIVPCLVGGLNASVTTSRGTVGENMPGTPAVVFLSPTEADRYSGVLEGETTLVLPDARPSRVEVRVADSDQVLFIPAADAGADLVPPPSPADLDAGASDGDASGGG